MKFKTVFYLLALILVVMTTFTLCMRHPFWPWYLGAELLLGGGLVVMYAAVVRPVSAVLLGIDLLRGEDYGSRLARVGQLDGNRLVDIFNDMMRQLRQEKLQRHEHDHFMAQLIEASPMGVVTLGRACGQIEQANAAAVAMLGCISRDELQAVGLDAVDSPLARSLASLADGERTMVRLSDTQIYLCSRLSLIDGGERRPFFLIESLSEEVRRAERQAYEKVIRIIAHEVNNTSAGVYTVLGTLESVLGSDPELAEAVESCTERIENLNAFITSYANVVRIPAPNLEVLDLNAWVSRKLSFLESLASASGIELTAELNPLPVAIAIDSILIEQVLVNLVKNAVESIGHDSSGGRIAISTGPHRLAVTDNGRGITDEAAPHLFTPFYSSKPHGQGLGLMFVAEILRRHNFSYSLSTSRSTGLTTFAITF